MKNIIKTGQDSLELSSEMNDDRIYGPPMMWTGS